MRRERTASQASFVIVLLAVVVAGSESVLGQDTSAEQAVWNVSDNLQVRHIAADVWLHTSWQIIEGGARFPSNGLIVREGDHVVLVDTAWGPELTEQLIGWIGQNIKLPIALAVATHFHDDRLGGASTLAAKGIPLLAQDRTRALLPETPAPTLTSIGDLEIGETMTVGGLELFYPGPAHTRDNLVVWVPGSRVLFGGCAIRSEVSQGLGNVTDADVSAWPAAVRRILDRYADSAMVVPGHGRSGGPQLLEHTLELAEKANN